MICPCINESICQWCYIQIHIKDVKLEKFATVVVVVKKFWRVAVHYRWLQSSSMQKRKRSSDADTSLHANEKRSKVEQSSSDLMQLLDVTLLSDSASISCRFDEIANLLLREFELVVKSSHKVEKEHYYKILELEFYLWKKECHEDPFTHGSEEQRLSGQWYGLITFVMYSPG